MTPTPTTPLLYLVAAPACAVLCPAARPSKAPRFHVSHGVVLVGVVISPPTFPQDKL